MLVSHGKALLTVSDMGGGSPAPPIFFGLFRQQNFVDDVNDAV